MGIDGTGGDYAVMLVFVSGPKSAPDPTWIKAVELSLKGHTISRPIDREHLDRDSREKLIERAVCMITYYANVKQNSTVETDLELANKHSVPNFINIVDREEWNGEMRHRFMNNTVKCETIDIAIRRARVLVSPDMALRVTPIDNSLWFKEPSMSHRGDAGYDLYVSETILIPPLQSVQVEHNLMIELPVNTWGHLVGRSSAFHNKGLHIVTGVVDNGFRGPMFTTAYNLDRVPKPVEQGDRISQLILMPLTVLPVLRVESLSETDRGDSGLGSTGQ